MGDDCNRIAVSTYLVILEHAAGGVVADGGVVAQGHACQDEGDVVLAQQGDAVALAPGGSVGSTGGPSVPATMDRRVTPSSSSLSGRTG